MLQVAALTPMQVALIAGASGAVIECGGEVIDELQDGEPINWGAVAARTVGGGAKGAMFSVPGLGTAKLAAGTVGIATAENYLHSAAKGDVSVEALGKALADGTIEGVTAGLVDVAAKKVLGAQPHTAESRPKPELQMEPMTKAELEATWGGASNPKWEPSKSATSVVEVGRTDLDLLRRKLGVFETDTIAVGKTDVKGLEDVIFEGQSPRVRSEAGLPDLDEIWANRNIKSPGKNPLFTRHAEEVLANNFDIAVIESGIEPQDVRGVLKIHQSNPTGVCRKCIQGLENDNVSPGVLKQLSLRYPNLRIEVTSETLPAVKVIGKSDFIIQDGKYIK